MKKLLLILFILIAGCTVQEDYAYRSDYCKDDNDCIATQGVKESETFECIQGWCRMMQKYECTDGDCVEYSYDLNGNKTITRNFSYSDLQSSQK